MVLHLYHDPDNTATADKLREIADRLHDGDYSVDSWDDTYAFCVSRDR